MNNAQLIINAYRMATTVLSGEHSGIFFHSHTTRREEDSRISFMLTNRLKICLLILLREGLPYVDVAVWNNCIGSFMFSQMFDEQILQGKPWPTSAGLTYRWFTDTLSEGDRNIEEFRVGEIIKQLKDFVACFESLANDLEAILNLEME